MKKFAKMSLVAAVAVAGLVSTSSAQNLAEAVKNVDVSGKVYVEFMANSDQTSGGETSTISDLDVDITFKSKVNDNVTAVVRAQADQQRNEETVTADHAATVDNLYFAYVNGNASANIGRFDLNTPTTDGNQAEGILASLKVGPATLIAGFATTSETTTGDAGVLAALASVGPVNLEAWYVDFSMDNQTGTAAIDAGENLTLVGNTTIEGVKLAARYATTNYNAAGTQDGNTLRLDASAAVSGVALKAMYLTTDKEGSAFIEDPSSANGYELSQLAMGNTTTGSNLDVSIWALGAAMPVNAVTLAVDYADYEGKAAVVEATELRFRATHKMSSNFTVMGTYSMYEVETSKVVTTENNSARIDFKYTF